MMDKKEELVVERELSFSKMKVCIFSIGADYLITLEGGDSPHIGGCVLAVPRPSLAGEGMSCTSSVINVSGHKDERLLRLLAEKKCRTSNRVVVCTGGFHQDGITAVQIREVQKATAELAELITASPGGTQA